MKSKPVLMFLALSLSTFNLQLSTGFAQGTAFTYQGRLTSGTNAATGRYDLTFALFDVSSGAGQQGSTITNLAVVPVTNGFISRTLDFGSGFFPGPDRWLEIAVRTNGNGVFATLNPRQKVTAAPYAITASNLSGALPSAQLSGTYGNVVTFSNAANRSIANGRSQ